MDTLSIVLLCVGIVIFVVGYIINKQYLVKKTKPPLGSEELVGTCVKHSTKTDKDTGAKEHFAEFSIVRGDETLHYKSEAVADPEKLAKIDSVSKFIITPDDPKHPLPASQFNVKPPLSQQDRNFSYALGTIGLICIVVVLIRCMI